MVLIVWGTEYVVDWVKHSFVTKFNKIDPAVTIPTPTPPPSDPSVGTPHPHPTPP